MKDSEAKRNTDRKEAGRLRVTKSVWYAFCIFYGAVMLWLLFFMRIGSIPAGNYTELLAARFEPYPFQVIIDSFRNIARHTPDAKTALVSLRNLLGNVVLFLPLGWILPYFLPFCRKFRGFVLSTVLLILLVELTQAFTLLGFCDFDDLFLNTVGAACGFFLQKPLKRVFVIPAREV